jgi:pyroglutamyl-peptidase
MARVTSALLTSFEPFGGHDRNSSLEVGRALAERPPDGVELDWLVLPVVAGDCVELAWGRVAATRPALVVALGQSARARCVRVETRAVNRHDFVIPDNAGNLLQQQPVVEGGPAFYRATASVAPMARALADRGRPVVRSRSAGTYVCNHLFYGLLHRAAQVNAAHRTAFLHLPLLPDQVTAKPGRRAPPSRALADLVAEVGLALAAALAPPVTARRRYSGSFRGPG